MIGNDDNAGGDDEPTRLSTSSFGGPESKVSPYDHRRHIYGAGKAGGHEVYHHDMFQTGYGRDACHTVA